MIEEKKEEVEEEEEEQRGPRAETQRRLVYELPEPWCTGQKLGAPLQA